MKTRITISLLLISFLTWPLLGQPQDSDIVTLRINVNNQLRRVVIQLFPEEAPQSVANFKKLVQSKYYEGIAVHRAIPNYLVQMGDPLTRDIEQKSLWGTGGPDYTVASEIGLPHMRGAVAMARLPDSRNPNRLSNGSQFYIALDDLPSLDGKYTVFGQVIRGIEHVDYISETTVDTNDVPVNRMEIAYAILGTDEDRGLDLGSATQGAKVAGETVKGAGGKLVGAIPFVGNKDKEGDNVPPAYEGDGDMAEAGSGYPEYAANDGQEPPEYDLLEDEIAASTTAPVDGPEDLEDFPDLPAYDEDVAMEELDPADYSAAQPVAKEEKEKDGLFGRNKEEKVADTGSDEKKGIGSLMPFGKKEPKESKPDSQNLDEIPIITAEEDQPGLMDRMIPDVGFGNKDKDPEDKKGFGLPFVGRNGPSDEDLNREEKDKKGLFGRDKEEKEKKEKEKGQVTKLIEKVW